MKKVMTLVALMGTLVTFAQRRSHFSQHSLEVDYGYNYATYPSTGGLNHYGFAYRYMDNEFWGVKIDLGHDLFTSDVNAKTNLTRGSVQAVYNFGRGIRMNDLTRNMFNILLHAGGGLTALKSDQGNLDGIVNIIIGGTGQIYLSEDFALTGDLSGILNFQQNYTFASTFRNKAFTGKMLTFSVGLTYYLGRNKSTADWR